jgi:glycosyltransferase involved in cell wall biosynthesis
MRYVLLIPGWFPSKVNFLAGDFIERHARAASVHIPVKVLFVVKDDSLPFGKVLLEHQQHSDHYETFIYYYSSSTALKFVEKVASVWLQARCLSKGFGRIVALYGYPALIHVHVLLKHAWFALKRARQYQIPLIASEQWTGYLPEAEKEFQSLSAFQRKTIGAVLRYASHVTTVSEYLAMQMRKRFAFTSYTVIPNLVDTSVFYPTENSRPAIITFIHISTLSFQKNFDEILQACLLLKRSTTGFRLIVFAPSHPEYSQKVSEWGLNDVVHFKKEMPQQQLSKEMADADALLLYSNYETFGCVIVEANACGVPVIVSDFPVFNENVEEGITGFKVPLHDPPALADCMMKIINKQHRFNRETIINITRKNYSSEVIGKQFADAYNRYAKP